MIVPSYFVPFGVVAATLLCGALRMRLGPVAAASTVGAALWSAMFVLLGYAGGAVTHNPLTGALLALPVAPSCSAPCSSRVGDDPHARGVEEAERRSGEVELPGLHPGDERDPLLVGERQRLLRAVLGVAHQDGALRRTCRPRRSCRSCRSY